MSESRGRRNRSLLSSYYGTEAPDADAAASNDTRRRRGGSDETGGDAFGSGSVAGAPPAALLTLFAHVPASASARRVAAGNAETRDRCAKIA